VHFNALVDTVVLQGTNHFQSGPVTDVCEARVLVTAEVPLENTSILSPVEECTPSFKFTHTIW
jgi:hypothetical protein